MVLVENPGELQDLFYMNDVIPYFPRKKMNTLVFYLQSNEKLSSDACARIRFLIRYPNIPQILLVLDNTDWHYRYMIKLLDKISDVKKIKKITTKLENVKVYHYNFYKSKYVIKDIFSFINEYGPILGSNTLEKWGYKF